jgi:glycosyltransferase involved in cell wall biosynthesis
VKVCYIANANSIHTQRWITPFIERGDQVYLLSYRSVERTWTGLAELVDLTQLTNVRNLRFVYWGWWLHRHVRRIKPDILHAHQLAGAGWLGVMADYQPFVVSGWGSDVLMEPHRSTLRRILVKTVLSRCTRVTVPSQTMYRALRELGVPEEKVYLVPWGIETDIFCPTPDDRTIGRSKLGLGSGDRVVFCPRKVSNLYNHDIVIEAVRAVMDQIPNLRLLFLRFGADPDHMTKLEHLIVEYGLEQVVLWLPPQESASDMALLYRMSDLVISIPSSEGYGFTVYEAMASGCPTLISDLPVFEDELTHDVHTVKVPVRDVPRTSRALVHLLTDASFYQQLRRNALSICQEKSAGQRVERTATMYRELVEKQ